MYLLRKVFIPTISQSNHFQLRAYGKQQFIIHSYRPEQVKLHQAPGKFGLVKVSPNIDLILFQLLTICVCSLGFLSCSSFAL